MATAPGALIIAAMAGAAIAAAYLIARSMKSGPNEQQPTEETSVRGFPASPPPLGFSDSPTALPRAGSEPPRPRPRRAAGDPAPPESRYYEGYPEDKRYAGIPAPPGSRYDTYAEYIANRATTAGALLGRMELSA